MDPTAGQRLKNVLGGSAGSFVERFDRFAHATFAICFPRAFFPQGDQAVQMLNSVLVAVPALAALAQARHPLALYALLLPPFALPGYTAFGKIINAEPYPAHVQAHGEAMPYAIAMAVLGGSEETMAPYLMTVGREAGFY